jgi:hypothetical protein
MSLASQFHPLLRNVIPVGVAARFVADSPLEGAGFEPSVPFSGKIGGESYGNDQLGGTKPRSLVRRRWLPAHAHRPLRGGTEGSCPPSGG